MPVNGIIPENVTITVGGQQTKRRGLLARLAYFIGSLVIVITLLAGLAFALLINGIGVDYLDDLIKFTRGMGL